MRSALLRLELARQAGDREIGRLRLLAGVAVASWLGTLFFSARLSVVRPAGRVALGVGWLLLLAALAASFVAQSAVTRGLNRTDARDLAPSGTAGALAPWLLVSGLAVIGFGVLFADGGIDCSLSELSELERNNSESVLRLICGITCGNSTPGASFHSGSIARLTRAHLLDARVSVQLPEQLLLDRIPPDAVLGERRAAEPDRPRARTPGSPLCPIRRPRTIAGSRSGARCRPRCVPRRRRRGRGGGTRRRRSRAALRTGRTARSCRPRSSRCAGRASASREPTRVFTAAGTASRTASSCCCRIRSPGTAISTCVEHAGLGQHEAEPDERRVGGVRVPRRGRSRRTRCSALMPAGSSSVTSSAIVASGWQA